METEGTLECRVRCICGHVSKVTGSEHVTCTCGAEVYITFTRREKLQSWVTTPDDYDLCKRKFNRPEIVSMRWI